MDVTVGAITRGRNPPSARFRVRQMVGPLRRHGVHLTELMPRVSGYPPAGRWARPAWAAAAIATRWPLVRATRRFDVTLLQRELVSTFETLERWTRAPRVLDVDDAIYLNRGGRAEGPVSRIARRCRLVVCGNRHLADRFSAWNPDVVVVPTAVDTARLVPRPGGRVAPAVLGWIGTRSNLPYLESIQGALERLLRRRPEARLRVVSDGAPALPRLPRDRVDRVAWSAEGEVAALQGFSVGLMPLPDTEWTRGKCSFKLLQYMAVGVPAVASPVGMNREVLAQGGGGLAASTEDEWVDAIERLLDEPALARRLGAAGRREAEASFSCEAVAPRLASALRSVV